MSTIPTDQQANFSDVLEAALSLYNGDVEAARHWMANPVKGLGGKSPVTMLATREETQSVLDYIGRLEHGLGA